MSTLERAPVFFAFQDSELRAIARRLTRTRVPAGEMIACQGEPGDSIFFIERGRCRVVVEKPPSLVTVSVLSEGEFFGEGACLLGRPHQASVYAQTDCHLLALDMPNLNAVLSSREENGTDELKRFAEQRFNLFADISVQATWGQLLQEATVVGVYSPKGGSGGTCISLTSSVPCRGDIRARSCCSISTFPTRIPRFWPGSCLRAVSLAWETYPPGLSKTSC